MRKYKSDLSKYGLIDFMVGGNTNRDIDDFSFWQDRL